MAELQIKEASGGQRKKAKTNSELTPGAEGAPSGGRIMTTEADNRNDNDFALNDKNKDLVSDLFKNQQQLNKSGRRQKEQMLEHAKANDQRELVRKRKSRSNHIASKPNQGHSSSKRNREPDSSTPVQQQKDNSSQRLQLKEQENVKDSTKLQDQKKVSITHMPSPSGAQPPRHFANKFTKRNTDSLLKHLSIDNKKQSAEIQITNPAQDIAKQFVIISAKPSNESIQQGRKNERYMDRDKELLQQSLVDKLPAARASNHVQVHPESDYVERAAYSQYSPRQVSDHNKQLNAIENAIAVNKAMHRPSLQTNVPLPQCVVKTLLTPVQNTSNTVSKEFSSVHSGSLRPNRDEFQYSGRRFFNPSNQSYSPNRANTIYSFSNNDIKITRRSPSNYQKQLNQAKQLLGQQANSHSLKQDNIYALSRLGHFPDLPVNNNQYQLYMAPSSQQPNKSHLPVFIHLPPSSLSAQDPQLQYQYLHFLPSEMKSQLQKQKKSTIEHATVTLPQSETAGMLKVGGLNQHLNRTEHLKLMRGQLDKMREYAREQFGYPEQYLKPHPIKTTHVEGPQSISQRCGDRLQTTTTHGQQHSRLMGERRSPSGYRFSQQDQHQLASLNGDMVAMQSKFTPGARKSRPSRLAFNNLNNFRNNQNLYIDSHNVQTDMAAGPDSPGITSLEFGGRGLGNDGLRSALDKNDLQSEECAGHSDAMNDTFFMKNTNTVSGQKDITRQLDEKDDTTDGLLSSITGNFPKSPGISGGMLRHKKDSFNIKTHRQDANEDPSASPNRDRSPQQRSPNASPHRTRNRNGNGHNGHGARHPRAHRGDDHQVGPDQIRHLKNEILDSAIQNAEYNGNPNPMSEEFAPKTNNEAKFKTIFHFEATQQSNIRNAIERETSSYLKSPPTPGDVLTPMSPHIHGQGAGASSFGQKRLQQSQVMDSSDYQDQSNQQNSMGKQYILQDQSNPRQRSLQGKDMESAIQMEQTLQTGGDGQDGEHQHTSELAKSQIIDNLTKSKSNQISKDSQKGSKFSKQKMPNIEEIISDSQLQYQKMKQHNPDKHDASSAAEFKQFQSPADSHNGDNMMMTGGSRPRSQFDGGKGGAQSNLQKATFPKNLMHQNNSKASNQNQVADYMVISSPEVKFPLLDMANGPKTRNQTLTNSQALGKESGLHEKTLVNDRTPGTSGTIAAATDTMADIVKHYVNTSNDHAHKNRQRPHGHLDDQAVQIKHNEKIPQVGPHEQKLFKTQQYDPSNKLGGTWLKVDPKFELGKLPTVRFSEDIRDQAQLQFAAAQQQQMALHHPMGLGQRSGSNSLSNNSGKQYAQYNSKGLPLSHTLNLQQLHRAQGSGQTSHDSSKSPRTPTSRNMRLVLSSKLGQPHRHHPEDSLLSVSSLGKKSRLKHSTLNTDRSPSKLKPEAAPYISKEAKRLNEFRQITFPTRKNPILPQQQPGAISFTSKDDMNPLMYIDGAYKGSLDQMPEASVQECLEDSISDFKLAHRDKIKLIKHEKQKKKNFDDQHRWKLLQQPPTLRKGLKAQLSKERQLLLKSFLSENQKKNKLRTLSTGPGPNPIPGDAGAHSPFLVHGAPGGGLHKAMDAQKYQYGSTISHGMHFAKFKSSSLGAKPLAHGMGSRTLQLKQGENMSERLAIGILNNSTQYPNYSKAQTLNPAAWKNLKLYVGNTTAASNGPWQVGNALYPQNRMPIQLLGGYPGYALTPNVFSNVISPAMSGMPQEYSKMQFQSNQQFSEAASDQVGVDEALVQSQLSQQIMQNIENQQKIRYVDFDKNLLAAPLESHLIELGQRQLSVENVPNDGSRQDHQLTLGHPLSDGINSVVTSPNSPGHTRNAAKKALLGASGSADHRGMQQRIASKKTEQTFKVLAATTKQSGGSNVNSGDIMSIDQNSSSLGNQIDLQYENGSGAQRHQLAYAGCGAPTPKTITQTQADIMNKYKVL